MDTSYQWQGWWDLLDRGRARGRASGLGGNHTEWLMLAGSRPRDGYIMEYQSSSPVGGNFGIGYSQGIARV